MNSTLVEELDALHNHYVVAVNEAVAADDHVRIERLAAAHEREATALVARREGGVRVLPVEERRERAGALRRLTRRGRANRAA